jgi:myo-inositol 2-dehydrogenase/D-chiro-inositol 1-dehydrogenase
VPETLGVGLLGCGGMATALAKALVQLPRARLVRVCDVAAPAAAAAGAAFGVPWGTEVGEVLADPAVGAVIVATPNATHADLVVAAARAGKHIFCEKPMALSVADCDRMIAAAAAGGVHLCLGHVLRYLPVFDRMRRMLDEGLIGRPFAVRVSRLGGWGVSQPWRQRRALSGGPLFEVNVHEIDFMRLVLGEPASVYASGSQAVVRGTDFEDTVFLTVRYRDGGHGVLHSSIAAARGAYSGEIQGTEGTIAFTNWPSRIAWKRFDGGEGVLEERELQAPDAHQRELGHLIEAALDGVTPPIGGANGRAAVAVAEAAVRSMETGTVVAVAPGPDGPA